MDPEAAFAGDGTLVAVWKRADGRPYISGSKTTAGWPGPFPLAPTGVRATAFQTIAVGPNDQLGVACLGGECFGEAGRGFLRFSCAEPNERLQEAHKLVAVALDPVQELLAIRTHTCLPVSAVLLRTIDHSIAPANMIKRADVRGAGA